MMDINKLKVLSGGTDVLLIIRSENFDMELLYECLKCEVRMFWLSKLTLMKENDLPGV